MLDIRNRLRIMLFLQYFIWGCWLTTLGSYLINILKMDGSQVGDIYSSKGLASLIMPAIIGIIADKYMSSKYVYALCHLVSAVSLFYAATVDDFHLLYWLMFINLFAYMPTLSLSNAISYFCLAKHNLDATTTFPKLRIFGTIGFIVAMWMISLSGFEVSHIQLIIASSASIILVIYTLTLPYIPKAEKKKNSSFISSLGLDAFVLFKKPIMAVFFLFAMLLGAILQITNIFGNPFLRDFGKVEAFKDSLVVEYPSILLSISQIAEVVFILAIPFVLKKFGIKKVMLISMFAWVLRFGFFAYGDPSPIGFWLLLASMIVYGCAFDFFNISGSIFIEKEVKPEIRASAQGLFMTMVNGFGAYAGSKISGYVVDFYTVDGLRDWQSIWLAFAGYALVLAIVFYFTFNYKHEKTNSSSIVH